MPHDRLTGVGVKALASASPLRVAGKGRVAKPTVPFSMARTSPSVLGASRFFLYGVRINQTPRHCHISQRVTDKMFNLFIEGRTWTL